MSEKKAYVKLWLSYGAYFQAYTPEQVGNIVLAMLAYKDTGAEPDFQGQERFIWPAIRRDMNEAQAAQDALAERSRENGRLGGRPRKEAPEEEENPSGFSETRKTTRTKDKDIDKGHCQGQGQRRPGAASGRLSAAERKNGYSRSSAESAREELERMERFLQQIRQEAVAARGTAPVS